MADETCTLNLAIKRETEKAYLVESMDGPANGEEVWLPKSLIKQGDVIHAPGRFKIFEFQVPQWLAEREGLV